MNLSVRFYISWILAALLMYGAFYTWHGIFLNDISRITFSKAIFFSLTAIVYLFLSFALYRTFESKTITAKIPSPMYRALLIGAGYGFMMFSIVTVLGVSFTKTTSNTYIIADFIWQIIEQLLGGAIIGLGKLLIMEPHPDMIAQD